MHKPRKRTQELSCQVILLPTKYLGTTENGHVTYNRPDLNLKINMENIKENDDKCTNFNSIFLSEPRIFEMKRESNIVYLELFQGFPENSRIKSHIIGTLMSHSTGCGTCGEGGHGHTLSSPSGGRQLLGALKGCLQSKSDDLPPQEFYSRAQRVWLKRELSLHMLCSFLLWYNILR